MKREGFVQCVCFHFYQISLPSPPLPSPPLPSPPPPSLPLVTERIHSPFQPKQSPSYLSYELDNLDEDVEWSVAGHNDLRSLRKEAVNDALKSTGGRHVALALDANHVDPATEEERDSWMFFPDERPVYMAYESGKPEKIIQNSNPLPTWQH